MTISKMAPEERDKVLAYLLPYEKFCEILFSHLLHWAPTIYVVKGNFGEIHGAFSFWKGSGLYHCLPDVYGKNREELENAFIKFFDEMSVQFLFSVVGEEAGTQMLKKILDEHFYKLPKQQNNYLLMENGRFDSKVDLTGMNTQLEVEICKEADIEKVFKLQAEFEKEDVLIENAEFDEERSRAKFENFVDCNAVYVGKIKNVPVCKATINERGKNYVLIGGVYTDPKYRNHGLGKALMKAVTEKMKEQFLKCTLFVKTENQAAIKLYESTGFKKLCGFQIVYY